MVEDHDMDLNAEPEEQRGLAGRFGHHCMAALVPRTKVFAR